MVELVKGQLDWHEAINNNFKEVEERLENVGDNTGDPFDSEAFKEVKELAEEASNTANRATASIAAVELRVQELDGRVETAELAIDELKESGFKDTPITSLIIYLSSNGSDNNSGLSEELPIHTFGKAMSILAQHPNVYNVNLVLQGTYVPVDSFITHHNLMIDGNLRPKVNQVICAPAIFYRTGTLDISDGGIRFRCNRLQIQNSVVRIVGTGDTSAKYVEFDDVQYFNFSFVQVFTDALTVIRAVGCLLFHNTEMTSTVKAMFYSSHGSIFPGQKTQYTHLSGATDNYYVSPS